METKCAGKFQDPSNIPVGGGRGRKVAGQIPPSKMEINMSAPEWKDIQRRAHEIWERQGRPEGREAEHWRNAQQSLEEESKGLATSPSFPGCGPGPRGTKAMSDNASQTTRLLDATGEPIEGSVRARYPILDSNGQPLRTSPPVSDLSEQLRDTIRHRPVTTTLVTFGFGFLLGLLATSVNR